MDRYTVTLLNSSLLGEELCAELIAQAARAKLGAIGTRPMEPVRE